MQAVFSESILRALQLNAARRRSSNVFKSVAGLKQFTKNVSAICTALSVSCGLLKFLIREEFSGLETDFKAAHLVEILLVVSHPVSAWRHHTSSSPRAAQTSCRGNIDLFSPELRMSHSSWRPRFLQLAVKWYNRQTKTSVSPDDSANSVACWTGETLKDSTKASGELFVESTI